MKIRMRGPSHVSPNSAFTAVQSRNDSVNDHKHHNGAHRFARRVPTSKRVISITATLALMAMTTILALLPSIAIHKKTRKLMRSGTANIRNGTSSALPPETKGNGENEKNNDSAEPKILPKNKDNGEDEQDDDRDAIECRYDGHCPVGRTCAMASPIDNPERLPGTCQKIPISKHQQATQVCLDACRRELEMDEHFFHEKWPEVIGQDATASSSGRPGGCVLYYKRTPDRMEEWQDLYDQDGPWLTKLLISNPGHGMQTHDALPTIKAWEDRRFRHIVRVDPAKPEDAADDTWMAYCTEPCQTDDDCQPTSPTKSSTSHSSFEKPFVCQQGACQRNSGFWEAMTVEQKQEQNKQGGEMVIVTGATSGYFSGLQNLMASVRYWAPHCKVVVYNLGKMTNDQKDWIRQQPNLLSFEWQDGIPNLYPPHVHWGKKYAWKPIIIQEALAKYKMIFWLDAGSTLRGHITPIEDIVKRNGIFLVHGQDESMTPKSYHKSYEWFNFTKETMVTGPHISGNTQAYLSPSRYVESLVNCNARCAMDPNCITPEGSKLANHRYDQTTLSLCAYHPKIWPVHHTEYLVCDHKKLPQDPRVASSNIVWTSRQGTSAYKNIEGNYLLDEQKMSATTE